MHLNTTTCTLSLVKNRVPLSEILMHVRGALVTFRLKHSLVPGCKHTVRPVQGLLCDLSSTSLQDPSHTLG
jgi:hypothetical protein